MTVPSDKSLRTMIANHRLRLSKILWRLQSSTFDHGTRSDTPLLYGVWNNKYTSLILVVWGVQNTHWSYIIQCICWVYFFPLVEPRTTQLKKMRVANGLNSSLETIYRIKQLGWETEITSTPNGQLKKKRFRSHIF